MEIKSDEKISLFVRDEQTGRFLFNARALQALGIDPILAKQCGYSLREPAGNAAPGASLKTANRSQRA